MDSRKLRAIYESLDIGANKQALKLCNALLKKKDAQIVKALKAVALARSGATQEALEICSNLQKSTPPPTDETLLNTMQLVYKAAEKSDEMITCYENAWGVDPRNETLASGLFFSCVRSANYAKQQQVALKMFKQFPSKDSYYYWAVFSIVMQAKHGEPRFLQLAERMMEKMETDKKIKTSEALQLYLTILQLQNKIGQAHALLAGPLGQLYNVPGERNLLMADFLCKQEKFLEALTLYQGHIASNKDEWNGYTGYIDCVLKLSVDAPGVVVEARNYLATLKAQEPHIRGPNLAELELNHRLISRETGPQSAVDSFKQLLVEYFVHFAAKPACIHDLRPYLSCVSQDSMPEFCSKLSASVEEAPLTIASVQKRITLLQVQRLLGFFSTYDKDTLVAHVLKLVGSFQQSLAVSQKIVSSERLAGDDFILLAVHTLEDLYKLDTAKNQLYLFEAIALLEYGLSISKQNFQFLLQLVGLYCFLGAFKPAYELYPQLSIRYIQLDTLSHLVLDDGMRQGFYQLMGTLFDQIFKFYADNSNITPDFISQAFIHNSYSKIEEITTLKTKLEQSHQLAIVQTEHMISTILNSDLQPTTLSSILSHPLEHDEAKILGLYSNQDLNVFDRWDPITGILEHKTENANFASTSARLIGRDRTTQLTWLRMRRFIIALIHKAVNGQDDSALREQFKAMASSLSVQKGTTTAEDFDALYVETVAHLFDANASFLLSHQEDGTEGVDFKTSTSAMLNSMQSLCKFAEDMTNKSPGKTSIPVLYMIAGEIFGWLVIVVQQWVLYKPKKKKSTTDIKTVEHIVAELKMFSETLKKLLFVDNTLSVDVTTGACHALHQLPNTDFSALVGQVISNVNKSYQSSKTSISTLLSTRTRIVANWPS